eukprot:TRINITY_DN4017_c0_g2_i1.p1 TRINITY_DN4017_c0_g2~~TRINITY_DN4017_c0_g2_i1.p1  ORF type:complete len:220 (+),score=25.73 TRINITY_DN4017_c0_g2_i1:69-662(+)
MAAPRGAVRCAAVCALLAPCGAPPTPRDRSAPPSAPPPPLWSPYEGPGGGGPGGIRTPPLSPGDCVVVVRMARSPLGGFLYPGTEGVVIGVPGATSGSAALVRFSDSAVRDVRPGDVWPLQCSTPPTPPPRAGQSTLRRGPHRSSGTAAGGSTSGTAPRGVSSSPQSSSFSPSASPSSCLPGSSLTAATTAWSLRCR